jgi:hypothetical protein
MTDPAGDTPPGPAPSGPAPSGPAPSGPAPSGPTLSSSGERPRPQYGEYASPEQQAKAMGAKNPPPLSVPPVASRVTGALAPSPPPPPYGQNLPRAATVTAPRRWDLMLSAVLLAYGLYGVVSGMFQFADLGALINRVYQVQGIGQFTTTPLATALGVVINVSDVVLFVATALITFALLRRGRIAFYVPLIGGVIAGLIAVVCILVLVFGDPAYINHFSGLK